MGGLKWVIKHPENRTDLPSEGLDKAKRTALNSKDERDNRLIENTKQNPVCANSLTLSIMRCAVNIEYPFIAILLSVSRK